MIDALGIGLSGLQKATQKVETAASNIANLQTPRDDGVIIDLSEEAVNLLLAETEYKANLATIKTADEMSDELLDIFDD
jgi:flagellar hook protein FlgE